MLGIGELRTQDLETFSCKDGTREYESTPQEATRKIQNSEANPSILKSTSPLFINNLRHINTILNQKHDSTISQ